MKVVGSIDTGGAGIIEPDDTYLSYSPENYSNVYILPMVPPCVLISYYNACNAIDHQNRMRQSDLALEKYWVTHSGCFRINTKVAFGMGITVGKILLYHGISG